MIRRELIKLHGLVDGPAEAIRGEVFEEESVAGIFVNVEMPDRVLEAAGGVCDWERTIATTDHLREATRFER